MQNYIFSIIIPHYNSPDLLMRCLGSIPVRDDIQVIVIDDCSPNSDDYLDRYPELCRPYLEYYKTPRGGSAGRARNIGLDHAVGKWVICMDADDLFVDNMEEILEEAKSRTEDVLYYNYKSVQSDDITKEGNRKGYSNLFQEYKKNKDEYVFRYCFDSMWGKIFRNKMIQEHHIRCDETRCGNDVAFSFKCGAFAKSIAVIDKPFFLVTERAGTLAASQFIKGKTSADEYKTRLWVLYNLSKFVDDNKLKIKYRAYPGYAYRFCKDWPKEFWKYYFAELLNKFTRHALWTLVYFVYFSITGKATSEAK